MAVGCGVDKMTARGAAGDGAEGDKMSTPIFTIEPDRVGLGFCVVATWSDSRRVVVTGFAQEHNATDWIKTDSERWLADIPSQVQGDQWTNDRLPKDCEPL